MWGCKTWKWGLHSWIDTWMVFCKRMITSNTLAPSKWHCTIEEHRNLVIEVPLGMTSISKYSERRLNAITSKWKWLVVKWHSRLSLRSVTFVLNMVEITREYRSRISILTKGIWLLILTVEIVTSWGISIRSKFSSCTYRARLCLCSDNYY